MKKKHKIGKCGAVVSVVMDRLTGKISERCCECGKKLEGSVYKYKGCYE